MVFRLFFIINWIICLLRTYFSLVSRSLDGLIFFSLNTPSVWKPQASASSSKSEKIKPFWNFDSYKLLLCECDFCKMLLYVLNLNCFTNFRFNSASSFSFDVVKLEFFSFKSSWSFMKARGKVFKKIEKFFLVHSKFKTKINLDIFEVKTRLFKFHHQNELSRVLISWLKVIKQMLSRNN